MRGSAFTRTPGDLPVGAEAEGKFALPEDPPDENVVAEHFSGY